MSYPFDCITDLVFVPQDEMSEADVILIPGGSHPQLMEAAAALYLKGLAPLILPSGGINSRLKQTEWEYLSEIGYSLGVPKDAILKEDQAKNTFDNARNSWKVLRDRGLSVNKAILVCKSHHSRRAFMTYQTVFPAEVEFLIHPVVDKNEITKDNWYRDEEKIKRVMKEAEKISTYFSHHIPKWIK